MLSVDFSALERQSERLHRLAEKINELESRIGNRYSRLSEMSERDEITAPLKNVLYKDIDRVRSIFEMTEINAGKLKKIVDIYSDNERELIKLADSLFIGISLPYISNEHSNTHDYFSEKSINSIFPAYTSQLISKQLINDEWLNNTMGDWRK